MVSSRSPRSSTSLGEEWQSIRGGIARRHRRVDFCPYRAERIGHPNVDRARGKAIPPRRRWAGERRPRSRLCAVGRGQPRSRRNLGPAVRYRDATKAAGERAPRRHRDRADSVFRLNALPLRLPKCCGISRTRTSFTSTPSTSSSITLHGRSPSMVARIVVSTHGGILSYCVCRLSQANLVSTVTRLSLKFYSAVIAVSASDYEMFSAIRSSGVVCIENGANVASSAMRRRAISRNRSCRLVASQRTRGSIVLVDFMRTLRRHDPDWTLTIAGRPGDLEERDVDAARRACRPSGSDRGGFLAQRRHGQGHSCARAPSSLARRTMRALAWRRSKVMSAGLFPLLSGIPPFRRLVARTGLGMIVDYSPPGDGCASPA